MRIMQYEIAIIISIVMVSDSFIAYKAKAQKKGLIVTIYLPDVVQLKKAINICIGIFLPDLHKRPLFSAKTNHIAKIIDKLDY
jgi:hypothetical protein